MKIMSSLVVVVALKAAVFLFPVWIIAADPVHSKESALIRETRETEMRLTRIVNHAFCDSSLSDEDKVSKKNIEGSAHLC